MCSSFSDLVLPELLSVGNNRKSHSEWLKQKGTFLVNIKGSPELEWAPGLVKHFSDI